MIRNKKPHDSSSASNMVVRGIRVYLLLSVLLLTMLGCTANEISEIEDLQSLSLFSKDDQLPETMSYINSIRRYDQSEFEKNVTSGLNRWYGSFLESGKEESWNQPSMLETLPDPIRQCELVTSLDQRSFVPSDAHFVQQSSWLKSISLRICKSKSVGDFSWMIEAAKAKMSEEQFTEFAIQQDLLAYSLFILHPDLEKPVMLSEDELQRRLDEKYLDSDSQKLAAALRLFDWTVRNIHLNKEKSWPTKDEVVSNSTYDDSLGEIPSWPPAAGAKGPGYTYLPWQSLTYARSDAIERANLFLNLLKTAGIDGVMLALPFEASSQDESINDGARPYEEWLPAALINDRFYLFDTEMGIIFPGAELGQIATLDEVARNPELISRLSLTVDESIEESDYRIAHSRLKDAIFLINISPESITKRMKMLESNLTGDNSLILTSEIDELAERLKKNEWVKDLRLWHIPFSALQFRETTGSALARASIDRQVAEKLTWYFEEEGYIDTFAAFRNAKNLFFRGVFETERNDPRANAVVAFNRFMYSDQEIAEFEQDTALQADLGIFQTGGQSFQEWESRLRLMKDYMTRIRSDAAFFLAMSHYENGMPSTALAWLERMDSFDDDARWLTAVNYQKARALEAIGSYDEAINIYRKKGSAQRYGNQIRARLVEQSLEKKKNN